MYARTLKVAVGLAIAGCFGSLRRFFVFASFSALLIGRNSMASSLEVAPATNLPGDYPAGGILQALRDRPAMPVR